jgi:hypothetical protein
MARVGGLLVLLKTGNSFWLPVHTDNIKMVIYHNDKDAPCNHWCVFNMFDDNEKYDTLSRV